MSDYIHEVMDPKSTPNSLSSLMADLEIAMRQVENINQTASISQSVYVMEECSEVIKEICKETRRKENIVELVEEEMDVICAVLIDLFRRGYTWKHIFHHALYKCNRAIDRAKEGIY